MVNRQQSSQPGDEAGRVTAPSRLGPETDKARREDRFRWRAAQKDPTLRASEIDHHLAKVRRHDEIVPDMARLSIRLSLLCPRISKQNPLRRRAR